MLMKPRAIHGKSQSILKFLKYHLPVPKENTVFNFKFYFCQNAFELNILTSSNTFCAAHC